MLGAITLIAASVAMVQAPSAPQQDPDSLAARLTELVEGFRLERGIPAVAMALVVDGQIVALEGFGRHGMDSGPAVDPARSRFRLASVAKLFVATAALQEVEGGRLDLDADLNSVLRDLTIPDRGGDPMTLRHLLTHTSGLDEQLIGYALAPGEARPSLGAALRDRLPPRIRGPGEVTSYSNAGFSLAAYAVESVAGTSFDAHLRDRLFLPLGMAHTSYLNVPDAEAEMVVPGYRCPDEGCRPAPEVNSRLYPPGLAFSTAEDMGRFIRFALGEGDEDVLSPSQRREMLTRQFSNDPRLPGIGWGWFEDHRNGLELWSHAGAVPGYSSLVLVIPEQRTGLFIINNGSSSLVNGAVADSLVAWLGDGAAVPSPTIPLGDEDDSWLGTYLTTRAPQGSAERFPGLFFSDRMTVTRSGDTLRLFLPNGRLQEVRKVGVGLFETLDGADRVVFRHAAEGTQLLLTHRIAGSGIAMVFEKVGMMSTPGFMNEYASWLLGGPVLLLLAWGIGRIGWWLLARRRDVTRLAASATFRIAVFAALVQTAAFVLFTTGVVARSTRDLSGGTGLIFGVSDAMRMKALLVYLVLLAALVSVWAVLRLWRRGEARLGDRLVLSALSVVGVLSVHFLVAWNYLPTKW